MRMMTRMMTRKGFLWASRNAKKSSGCRMARASTLCRVAFLICHRWRTALWGCIACFAEELTQFETHKFGMTPSRPSVRKDAHAQPMAMFSQELLIMARAVWCARSIIHSEAGLLWKMCFGDIVVSVNESFRSNWSNYPKPGPKISRKHEHMGISVFKGIGIFVFL